MVVKLEMIKGSEKELEQWATRVFLKAIDLLGGLSNLTEYRALTWLPSLARACYSIVLREEYLKTEEEIASIVGISKNAVRTIFRADPQKALYKIEHFDELTKEEKNQLRSHTAGGIAKLAYKLVKDGEEAQIILDLNSISGASVAQVCDVPWAYSVLKHTKGTKYPILRPDDIREKLQGISIKGEQAETILEQLSYPIKSPAQLLHEIKEYLQMKEKI